MSAFKRLNPAFIAIVFISVGACATAEKKAEKEFIPPQVTFNAGKTRFDRLPPEFVQKKPVEKWVAEAKGRPPVRKKIPEVTIRLADLGVKPEPSPKMSINMRDASITEVIELVGDIAGLNFFIHPDANNAKPLDLTLSEIAWSEALEIIITLSGLTASVNGEDIFANRRAVPRTGKENVIVINTFENLQRQNDKRRQLAGAAIEIAESRRKAQEERSAARRIADRADLVTLSYRFRFADPAEALSYLERLFIDYEKETFRDITKAGAIARRAETMNKYGTKKFDYDIARGYDKSAVTRYRKPGSADIRFSVYRAENLITITAPVRKIDEIMERIRDIDVKPRQVYIVARIVEIQRNHISELGIQWGGYGTAVTNKRFPQTIGVAGGSAGGIGETGNVISLPPGTAVDPATGNVIDNSTGGVLNVTLGHISGASLLNAKLFALEEAGVSRTVSNPKVMAINGIRAEIKSGREIPYQSSSANTGTTVRFKEAVIALAVTPLIMQDDSIRLRIEARKDEVDTTLSVQGTPSIKKKELNTSVVVRTGGSVVLGGVFEGEEGGFQDRVPWVHKIPFLGWLFKNDRKIDNQLELLMFITPTII